MARSETGERGGFTLIEVLLALALVGLLSWIFVGGSTAILANKNASPDDQFWKAVAQARKQALVEQRSIVLTYDEKAKSFVMSDGANQHSVPVAGPDDLVIDFHPVQTDSSSSTLIGGTLIDSEVLNSATFYSDGTCTPFSVQFRVGGAAHLLTLDPWTCAQVIVKPDAS
jgi:prepilin-type N-terminal cleavage/methylation domain-containing protein